MSFAPGNPGGQAYRPARERAREPIACSRRAGDRLEIHPARVGARLVTRRGPGPGPIEMTVGEMLALRARIDECLRPHLERTDAPSTT